MADIHNTLTVAGAYDNGQVKLATAKVEEALPCHTEWRISGEGITDAITATDWKGVKAYLAACGDSHVRVEEITYFRPKARLIFDASAKLAAKAFT